MLTNDLAFLLPITTLLIIGVVVLFVLDATDKRSRDRQMRLPFDESGNAR